MILREGEGETPKILKIACPIFNVLDADGVLSAEEIENAWWSLILLDANGDGTLTLEEIQAARQP